MMKMALSQFACTALLSLGLFTSALQAQVGNSTGEPDAILASIEGTLTREALNATRMSLEDMGHTFNYGSFQFRPDGKLVGVEIFLIVEGQEFREYVEFVSDTCILEISKAQGIKMEGC
jgi:hypothetical protein